MGINHMLDGMEDPWDRLNRMEAQQAHLLHQQSQLLRHIAGISQNQANLIEMWDTMNQKVEALEAVFREKI